MPPAFFGGDLPVMTMRASRGARLFVVAALAWLGLALCAQAANATYSKVTIVKNNVGGPATDTFEFGPTYVPAKANFSIKGGEANKNTTQVECNVGSSCAKWNYPAESVSELPKSGYTLTGINCYHEQGYNSWPSEPTTGSSKDTDTTVSGSKIDLKLKMWEWVKCYVTNTRDQGQIEVTKHVVAPYGDTGKFNLLVDGAAKAPNVGDGGTTGWQTVDTGTHSVGESAGTATSLSDYDAGIACKDTAYGHTGVYTTTGTSLAGLTVGKGDKWDCAITNTRHTAVIEVHKHVVGAPNSPADPGLFDLLVDQNVKAHDVGDGGSTNDVAVLPGTHAVSEAAGTGTSLGDYTSSVACERKVPADPKVEQAVDGTSLDNLSIAAGEQWQCTITNVRKTGTLEIVKHVVPAPGQEADAGLFDLHGTGPSAIDALGVGDGGTTGVQQVLPGSYSVAEAAGAGTSLNDYASSIHCESADPAAGQDAAGTSIDGLQIAAGEAWRCTITNVRKLAGISIHKTGPATATAGDLITYTLEVGNTGNVAFPENLVTVTDALCVAPPALQAKNGDATPGTLDPGDDWTYTCQVQTKAGQTAVHNVADVHGSDGNGHDANDEDTFDTTLTQPVKPKPPVKPVAPVKPVPPAVTPRPGQGVSPVRIRPGSARLRGPRSCATGAVAASVSGRRIAKVTFFVDGKKVTTLTKANRSGGRWVLALNAKRFGFRAHKVRARVQFAASSQTRAKTLRMTFIRCRPAVVTPKFTG
jgi:uncharacterized repeat protein (TIGR01451 family)